jgi:glucosamine-6-phosphate deaminase
MPPNAVIAMIESFEKVSVEIFDSPAAGSQYAARQIAELMRQKEAQRLPCVLGLATGSSPVSMYKELVRMHREEGLSFRHVVTFNLDEYYPLEQGSVQSYYHFMQQHLFGQVDINPANVHLPDGSWPKEEIKARCHQYEQQIEAVGGIDLQVLGIGNNGHIGFNEPGSSILSKTRLVTLDNSTRIANARLFRHLSEVPRLAISMGISTILKAKKVLLLAWGSKAGIVAKSVEGNISEQIPASLLQHHADCTFVIDKPAAAELTRIKSPWLTGECEWDEKMMKRAVINMALKLNKPVLSLTTADYNENGLSDLLLEKGDAYEVNLQVFYKLRDSITGWPGGKPNSSSTERPERSEPYPKRCLIFSPHPDDDIISMGGTFMRLHQQGHQVHVGYQTSGNIAVTDEFVTRFMDFAIGFEELFGVDSRIGREILSEARQYLLHKTTGQQDSAAIRAVKGLIRRCEARATCRYVGLPDSQIHFLNLPFYETGTIEKKPMEEEDINITMQLLRQLQPHQVYCAGDLADPHGTHKVCLDVVLESFRRLKEAGDKWLQDCWLWLYKGAWQEWDITEIQMAVPMSPDQVVQKRNGIFIHQSQKDTVPFQGADSREFWQRAEDRNAHTANLYAQLGLTKFAAIEAFVKWQY